MTPKSTSAEELDRLFDEGSDEIDQYIDWSSARRIHQTEQVVVELPAHLVAKLNAAAEKAGMSRQVLVESWIASELAKTPIAA